MAQTPEHNTSSLPRGMPLTPVIPKRTGNVLLKLILDKSVLERPLRVALQDAFATIPYRDFLSCLSTSKSLYYLLNPVLYRHIKVVGFDKFLDLMTTLSKKPHRAAYVTNVELLIPPSTSSTILVQTQLRLHALKTQPLPSMQALPKCIEFSVGFWDSSPSGRRAAESIARWVFQSCERGRELPVIQRLRFE
jgi:hypothetical protein